jgi:hypothetical protein
MRVPTVIRTLAAVGDFESTNAAYLPHFGEDSFHGTMPDERLQGFGLHIEQLSEVITASVWRSQREQQNLTTLGTVHADRLLNLDTPPLGDLGGADRARPDTAAGLQAAVVGRTVLV